ncbi:MAG: rare lipoprotein A [Rhodothermales bacterium]|jgi:rare lipoprotein A
MRVLPLILILLLSFEAQAQSTVSVVAYPEHMAGRRTASGKVYNPHGLTVAHPSLPFGTMLEMTAPSGGSFVTVEVNDRGLMLGDGELILSAAAMNRLGLDLEESGLVSVRQWREGNRPRIDSAGISGSGSTAVLTKETMVSSQPTTPEPSTATTPPASSPQAATAPSTATTPPASPPAPTLAASGLFAVQMGSFSDKATALKLAGTLDGAWIQSADVDGKPVHRVFFGHFRQRNEAEGWQARLSGLGVNGYVRSVLN